MYCFPSCPPVSLLMKVMRVVLSPVHLCQYLPLCVNNKQLK